MGGGIHNRNGTLNVENCIVRNNEAFAIGGGIYNKGKDSSSTVTIINSEIRDNRAGWRGGGVASYSSANGATASATVTITDSTISGNEAFYEWTWGGDSYYAGDGGGISTRSNGTNAKSTATLTITNSTISNNEAVSDGGTIYASSRSSNDESSVTVMVTDSIISENKAFHKNLTTPNPVYYGGGGAINLYSYSWNAKSTATLTITNTTLSNNEAADEGGAIDVESVANSTAESAVDVTIINSTISGNSAGTNGRGGGIYCDTDDSAATLALKVINSTITGNSATTSGGGIYCSNASGDLTGVEIKRSLIAGNTAPAGAELFAAGALLNLGGYNLLGHDGLTTAAAFNGVTLNATDVSATSDSTAPFAVNAILGPLKDNGGPTPTHALSSSSPADDLAPLGECGTAPFNLDQRGSVRPSDSGCDAGAYERKSFILWMMMPILKTASERR